MLYTFIYSLSKQSVPPVSLALFQGASGERGFIDTATVGGWTRPAWWEDPGIDPTRSANKVEGDPYSVDGLFCFEMFIEL